MNNNKKMKHIYILLFMALYFLCGAFISFGWHQYEIATDKTWPRVWVGLSNYGQGFAAACVTLCLVLIIKDKIDAHPSDCQCDECFSGKES